MGYYVFLARDPGAYAAIVPAFMNMREDLCKFFCFGTAAAMDKDYASMEDTARDWIKSHSSEIKVLVCGTGVHTEFELSVMEECKQRGIYTVSILDYWSNYKNRFLLEDRVIWPDDYIVMDELAKNEAIGEGVPRDIIRILGHPGLDEVVRFKDSGRELRAKPCPSDVLLLGEPMSGRTNLGYDEEIFFSDCVAVLKKLNKKFSIKFHPRDDAGVQEQYSTYHVDGDLPDIAAQNDIVIGMTTIALLHCSIMGKNTVSYQPGLTCQDGCISNKLGMSKLITTRNELLDFLSRPVYKRDTQRNELIWMDGKSTERVVRYLKGLE